MQIHGNSFAIIATLSHSEELRTHTGNNFRRRVTYACKMLKVTKFSVNFSNIRAMLSLPPRQPMVTRASLGIWNTLRLLHKAFCRSLRIVENPQWQWEGCFFSHCHIPLEHTPVHISLTNTESANKTSNNGEGQQPMEKQNIEFEEEHSTFLENNLKRTIKILGAHIFWLLETHLH